MSKYQLKGVKLRVISIMTTIRLRLWKNVILLAAVRNRYDSDLDGLHVIMWIEYNTLSLSQ